MTPSSSSARVFISCGQDQRRQELEAAKAIAAKLVTLGYEPHLALEQQTLSAIRDAVFARLEQSEYFLFVDFAREHVAELACARGSLFSHQELAIGSFLGLDVIAFRENGVHAGDGLLQFIQANAESFSDRTTLPDRVAAVVKERWTPHWRRELVLESTEWIDANTNPDPKNPDPSRFFHVVVRNRDHRRHARNCTVYLERLEDERGKTIPLESLEFKWAGTPMPQVTIPAGGSRRFDVVNFFHRALDAPQFTVHTDSTQFLPRIPGFGRYRLSFLIVSDNFSAARGTVQLRYMRALDDVSLELDPPVKAPNA